MLLRELVELLGRHARTDRLGHQLQGLSDHQPSLAHPQDLVRHVCINMRQETAGGLYAWEFEKDGQALRVRVDGQLTFNNTYAMIDAAVSGYGIAYVPENIVERQIASGLLVQVLDDWSPFFDGYFLYYPSRRQNLPAFKVIIEALRQRD